MDVLTTTVLTESYKVFLQSIIKPSLDEVGGLLADKIKFLRYKNQVRMLEESETLLREKGIKIRQTSIKLLESLLEGVGLEEDIDMQDKWTKLFANTVRENSDIETTLYPYILSQMTSFDAELMNIFNNERQSPVYLKELLKLDSKNAIIIDNLLRLRLIKELRTRNDTANLFMISDLGSKFMKLCTEVLI